MPVELKASEYLLLRSAVNAALMAANFESSDYNGDDDTFNVRAPAREFEHVKANAEQLTALMRDLDQRLSGG